MLKLAPDAQEIIFDTKDLAIEKILLDDSEPVTHVLADSDPLFGQALRISLKPDTKTVSIFYTTSPEAEALQWLSPQQTASKNNPFLFTQSAGYSCTKLGALPGLPQHTIYIRSRSNRTSNLLALMSASNPKEKNTNWYLPISTMKQPIPSYLLALSVGDIEFHEISKRSGIYAEPSSSIRQFGNLQILKK